MKGRLRVALLGLAALDTPSANALPALSVVDNGGGSAALQVITTDASDILRVAITGEWSSPIFVDDAFRLPLQIAEAAPSSDRWAPVAALNPYTGGETSGLYFSESDARFFASFETTMVDPGALDFLDFVYTGDCGSLRFLGIVDEDGQATNGLSYYAEITCIYPYGDFDRNGYVDIIDFGFFADVFSSAVGDPLYDVIADCEPDGDIDIVDFGCFADNFGVGTALAVPEPTAALPAFLGAVLAMRRRR